ncbi:hypothetical protein HZ996_04710 [Cryomorphaceae bacterium]|nr:hypothetical protein HZ996_04710 [Cryomorphaceae bacterium]
MEANKPSIIQRVVLSLGILAMLYAGISAVNYLDKYIHLSDEVSTYNGLAHAVESGVPLAAPHPESVNFNPDLEYKTYDSHRFILYFNVPAYFILQALNVSVEKWYGGWPFVLTMLIMLLALWIRPTDQGPKELAILFLPTILSSWTMSSLHFIRYYGYMYVFGIVCSFAAYKIYYSKRPYGVRVLAASLLLLIPGLFHQTLFSILVFGLLAMIVDFFTSGLHKEYPRKLLLAGGGALIALLVAAATIPALRLNVAIGRFFREWDPSTFGQALGNYMDVNHPEGAGWFLFNLIMLFGGGYLALKRNDFYGRFFRISAGYFVFALVLYSMIMGGTFIPPYGFNRYYLIVHVAYLVSIGLFGVMAFEFVAEKLKKNWSPIPVYVGVIVLAFLAVGNVFSPFSMDEQNFSLVPRYERDVLDYLDSQIQIIENKEREVIFVTGQVGLVQHYYPQYRAIKLGPKTRMEDFYEIGKANPKAVLYVVMANKPPRNDVAEFLRAIYPKFNGEMKVRGKEMVRAYEQESPRIKKKYGLID